MCSAASERAFLRAQTGAGQRNSAHVVHLAALQSPRLLLAPLRFGKRLLLQRSRHFLRVVQAAHRHSERGGGATVDRHRGVVGAGVRRAGRVQQDAGAVRAGGEGEGSGDGGRVGDSDRSAGHEACVAREVSRDDTEGQDADGPNEVRVPCERYG